MFQSLRESWHLFKESQPGCRFQNRYYRHQQKNHKQRGFKRLLKIIGGIIIALAGVFFMPAPGPGWGIFFIGAAMVAGESIVVARSLDRIELRLRALERRLKAIWVNLPVAGKVLVGIVALACAVAIGYGAFYWVF